MLSDLENYVLKLHECLVDASSAGELPRSIISDIVYKCGENISQQTISFCLSVFFKKEKNLLTFLRKAISLDELRGAKVDLLEFLCRFISAAGKQVLTYAAEIKETCISVFNSDKYSDVRCGTFPIMTKLLEISSGNGEAVSRMGLSKLVDVYFHAWATPSKLSASLKAHILVLLGALCRYHPEIMLSYSDKCLNIFLDTLKAQVKASKPDFNVIAGALEAINQYLYNFTQSAEEGSKNSREIFKFAKLALTSNNEDLTRYAMPRAALDLLAKHAEQFDEFIYDEYEDLFARISQWAQHKNYDIKKLAYTTLDSYYKQLAEMLRRKAKEDSTRCKKIFSFFIKKFYKNLTESTDLKETVISIKGYGAFAGPCREFMESKDVRLMLSIIIDICERTFLLNPGQEQGGQMVQLFDEKVYQLPSFIESLACVCSQIEDSLPEGAIVTLEKLVLLAIDSYPKLIKRYNYQISLAVARLFIAIQLGKSVYYNDFVSRIVYQSLIRIFSYRTNYFMGDFSQSKSTNGDSVDQNGELMNPDPDAEHIFNVTSCDYVPFWSNLLNLSEFKELNAIGVHINDRKKLVRIIYDEFVESLIKIVKKLDLSAVKSDSNSSEATQATESGQNSEFLASSNPIEGLRPLRPKDFEILVNLVDFSRELLMQKHFDLFEKFMYKFSKEVILLSSKNVLISSFYRLGTLCMRVAIKIGYFSGASDRSKRNETMLGDESNATDESVMNESDRIDESDEYMQYEKLTCFHLYKKYIKEVHVRVKQFKDELLSSCLEFLLSLPKELVVENLDEVFDALKTSLELGINYLPMAENALNSLDYWFKNIKLDKLKPYYSLILNKFDDYLQLNKSGSLLADGLPVQEKIFLFKQTSYKGRGRKKLPVKLFEKNLSYSDGKSDLYEQIQIRILNIIGQLAGEMGHCMHDNSLAGGGRDGDESKEVSYSTQMLAWDTVQHLKFYVPFVDMKPAIYFDKFLPRVIYLALSSTNRQTKINACELLHAIVVYMIGKSVSDPTDGGSNNVYQLNKLYHFIYPALFRLACDVDQFARNLFHPLVMQMIHWFTGNRKYESVDTIELLNCIMDCLVDEKDAALRDLSASALREFLKWSIKHTPLDKQDALTSTASSSSSSSVNVKSILKRIFNMLTHPNCAKRLGASLAWNTIYVIFREEETLVNKYIFELLYYLVESLAMAEKDDKMYGTQEHCKLALDHIERIVRTKADVLNQRSSDRVRPPGWSESVLEVAVRWLMRQCGRIETECRHKCMELVHKLAPFLPGVKDTRDYFQLRLSSESETYYLARFEGSADKKDLIKDSLSNFKLLTDLDQNQSSHLVSVQTWLAMLTAPLDCYSWVFGERLLTPLSLFSSNKSCIWSSLNYFIENIMNNDLSTLIKQVYQNGEPSSFVVCSPSEIDDYNRAKCTAIIRLCDFLCTMMANYPAESVKCIQESQIWTDSLFTCIVNMCLDPQLVGFNLNDLDVYTNLPIKTRAFLKLFTQHMPANLQSKLKKVCRKIVGDEKKEVEALIQSISGDTSISNPKTATVDWIKLSQLVTGYEQLDEYGLYEFPHGLNRTLFDFVCNKSSSSYEQESLTSSEAKRKLFNLCMGFNSSPIKQIKTPGQDYLIEIIDKYLLNGQDGDEEKKSLSLFTYFKSEVCSWICRRHDVIMRYLLAKVNVNMVKIVTLLTWLMEYLIYSEKQLKKSHGVKIVQTLYENWSCFKDYWHAESPLEQKILLVSLLTKSLQIDSIVLSKSEQAKKNVSEMYMSLLVDTKTKLNFKAKLLDLLYFFCDSPAPYTLKPHMNQFLTQLPLRSQELVKGEEAYNDYVVIMRKTLASLCLSLSTELLSTIVSVVCRESEHICDEYVTISLTSFIKHLETSRQESVIASYWEGWSRGNDDERKYTIFRKVLLVFLENCEKPVFVEFLCKNLMQMVKILDEDVREATADTMCLNKKNVFEVLTLAYKRLYKDEIFSSASSRVCSLYEKEKFGQVKDGKELTKEVLRKCRKYLCEDVVRGPTASSLTQISSQANTQVEKNLSAQRQLHCSAYNCLVSLFIRTQTEPKLYTAFLFKDDTSKNELIFEQLVDKNKTYQFQIETESVQDKKTRLVSLRNEFRDQRGQSGESSVNYISTMHSTNTMAGSVTYMNTQNMYESSLSDELSAYDFTTSGGAKNSMASFEASIMGTGSSGTQVSIKRKPSNIVYVKSDQFLSSDELANMNIEIETDELNQNESMCAFVELLQSLVANRITPIYERGHVPSDMPPWMAFLHKKCQDIYTHENVKLFIIRGLVNVQHVFKSYAKFWYAPLIAFLVNSSLSRQEVIDYFTLDLMVLLLSWHSVALPQPSEKKLINRLFESLIKRCYHDNRAILKNNLELLKTMTECWRDFVDVPVGLLNNYLTSYSDQKKVATGIQLFGLVLSNNIETYDYPPELDKVDFYKSLIISMNNPSKTIHAPSAEVVGMLLRKLSNNVTGGSVDEDILNQCLAFLFDILSKLDISAFITCVHRIQLNYPPISERCMVKLVFNLPKLYGEFKLMCAESILSSIKTLEDPLFKMPSFMDMLTHRESSLQLVCLKMIYELLDKQTDDELSRLLPIICSFINHPYVACRYQMILILISVYDKCKAKPNVSVVQRINILTSETLLRALLDEDSTIRLMAQNFWTERANMPTNTIDRMVLILNTMYSPQTESEYLSYSTNLLLEKTSKSPDYNRLIYEQPLSQCTFKEYNLTADWRRRHEMMTPLFVETVNSLSEITGTQSGGEMVLKGSEQSLGMNLRATQQSLQFQPTQEIGKSAYNWLTQSNVDTMQASLISSSLSETQSALLFTHGRKLTNKDQSGSGGLMMNSDDEILKLRKRFIKDKSAAQSRFFARKQIEKKSREEEMRRELSAKRLNRVEKYRVYRIGDFPDIQIKFAELIAPLQALAQRDSQIAMLLFDSLFVSIMSEVTYLKDETEAQQTLRSIECYLNAMLSNSESFNPNFIACVLDIALKNVNKFRLDVSCISSACLNSLQQPLGIILIEEYIVQDEHGAGACFVDEQPRMKRVKLIDDETSSKESILWIELAMLYRSMNDYDSIKGIFMRKDNLTTEFTKRGFHCESSTDYYGARKEYLDALNVEDWSVEEMKPSKLEEELWEQSLLRCCNELADWKTMCEWSLERGKLNDLFTEDTYTLERLFPYAFRSKLKLILQEDVKEQEKHVDLVHFLQTLDSDGKKYMEQNFCLDMALINLHQKDLNAAKYYANMAIQKYLMEWSSINKTMILGRISKLQSLQAIIELNEFLKFIDSNQSYSMDINRRVGNLIELWSNSMPNTFSDPPSTWDDVITNRCIYYEFIEDKYYRSSNMDSSVLLEMSSFHNATRIDDEDDDEDGMETGDYSDLSRVKKTILRRMEKSKILMKIKFAEAAECQGNTKLALNKLNHTKFILKENTPDSADLKVAWIHCYLNTHLTRAKSFNDPKESLNALLNANVIREMTKYDESEAYSARRDLFENHQFLHAEFTKFLVDSLARIQNTDSTFFAQLTENDKNRKQLVDFIGIEDITNVEKTVHHAIEHGISSLSKVGNTIKGSLELASYCDYYLRQAENQDDATSHLNFARIVKSEFPATIIRELLHAMKLNSHEARQRFPRLLQIIDLYHKKTSRGADLIDVLVKSASTIPSWMFLGWLSQMTAILDKPEWRAISGIVQRIADEYPQAVVYPFRMSYESFKLDTAAQDQPEFIEKLKHRVNQVPLVNQFIASLEHLSSPGSLFKDYYEEISKKLNNRDNLIKIFKEFYVNLVDWPSAASGEDAEVEWGSIRKNFAKFLKPVFEQEFGENGKLIASLSEKEIGEKMKRLAEKVNNYMTTVKEGNLGEYSPWLKSFKRNVAKDLEIPGQYTGKQKPMPEYHVKIESFDERLLVMSSLRRPKCITIRGNDQKDHKFLVKSGEDQRQDDRIETLFDLINDLLRKDSRCYQRNLSIKTYQVIPMSGKLALIEWIPDTKTLKSIFEDDPESKEKMAEATNTLLELFAKIPEKKDNIIERFKLAYEALQRQVLVEHFERVQEIVPWDLMRRFVRSMAANTEAYFVLRNQFISSYAVASTCQYMLGIGDRHLSNWLIDMKTGRAIGIDFGMAFGHATMNIPVPELMPIRLTRQILKLIAPLEHRGLFEASMLHTVRALRENNDILMCILDVFVKEPSLDWLGSAARIVKRNLNEEMQFSIGVQYAKGRVNSARDKLYGINPCVITRNDLASGLNKESQFFKHFVRVAIGTADSERAKLLAERGDDYRLTTEEQVKCIIEQSTDPNILARAWIGWQPYL